MRFIRLASGLGVPGSGNCESCDGNNHYGTSNSYSGESADPSSYNTKQQSEASPSSSNNDVNHGYQPPNTQNS
jgi:hypothetical protein